MILALAIACAAPDPVEASPVVPRDPAGVRFAALGDQGSGTPAQARVGEALARVCRQRGCDFVLLLGDNAYPRGVRSLADPLWQQVFDLPYADVPAPFYAVLGNHDYGRGFATRRARVQVARTDDRWHMPGRTWHLDAGPASIYGLDTLPLALGTDWGRQAAWLAEGVADDEAPWVVVAGHHTWRSNGQHGSAGAWDGARWGYTGERLDQALSNSLCGRPALYLAGHDHNRQWLAPTCGVEVVVSGAGSKIAPLAHRVPEPTLFEDASEPGFVWLELTADGLTGLFYDADGQVDFHRTVRR